jgi:large subunit ribosomal protein L4
MKATIYNQKGTSAGTIDLPESVFGLKWKTDLVHQVVEGIRSNKRAGTADTKGRGEVRGGGKKPWKQKGTGRARHGSSRSPIWVGGGVTHGPLAEKNYKKKINKKMRIAALFTVLSKKFKDEEIIFVDSLAQSAIKTKTAMDAITNISKGAGIKDLASAKKARALVALSEKNTNIQKSFRNIPSLEMAVIQNINPMQLLNQKYLIIENPEVAIAFLTSKLEK